ncbi:TPA: hypothetical protein WH474_001760 [Neisseria meningitidis]
MSVGQVREIFERFGKYNLVQTEYRRFKADKTENRNHKANSIFEFLHILEKTFYSGLTKTSTALPRFSSKRTILSGAEAPSESVPYYLYCLRLRRLVLIFVNPL